jgi:hypothetical protein
MIVTSQEAVTLIEDSLNNVIPLDGERLEKVIYAANNSNLVRDWILGMPNRYTLDESIQFVSYMAVKCTAEDSVPFITANGIYSYEKGDLESADAYITYALKIDKNYSLAQLMKRTLKQGINLSMPLMRLGVDVLVLNELKGKKGAIAI